MSKLFAYYGTEMRRLGWTPVARVMGETSVLTFIRGDRVVTIQITPNTMTEGSVVTLTMSPRDPQHYSDVVPVAREKEGLAGGDASAAYSQQYRRTNVRDRSVHAERLPPQTYPTSQTSSHYRR